VSYSTNLLQFVLTGTLGNGLDGLSLHALSWLVSSAVVAGVAGVAGMAGVAGVAGVAAPWAMPLLPTGDHAMPGQQFCGFECCQYIAAIDWRQWSLAELAVCRPQTMAKADETRACDRAIRH
jgi:hypothetical protein